MAPIALLTGRMDLSSGFLVKVSLWGSFCFKSFTGLRVSGCGEMWADEALWDWKID